IAPGHGIGAGRFDASYFDPYVDRVWSHYADTDLVVTTNAGTFTGRVEGEELLFDGGVSPISRPSTADVLFCDGALAAPNDGITGPVAAAVGAAFNRSTVLTHAEQPTDDPADFYRDEVSNRYAAVFHENTEDGEAYGFAFDDVAGCASYAPRHGPSAFAGTPPAFWPTTAPARGTPPAVGPHVASPAIRPSGPSGAAAKKRATSVTSSRRAGSHTGLRSLSTIWARTPSTRSGEVRAAQELRYSCSRTAGRFGNCRARRNAFRVTFTEVG